METDPILATLDGLVEARDCAAEEVLVRNVGVVGWDCECARG